MLENLSVRNYVLIDSLDISFNDGFTVLTGETGSGKSIMLGALSLLLGAKTDKEAVRQGESSAEISGIFSVNAEPVLKWAEDHGIEIEDSTLVIRRLIKTSGRSVYTVNGSPVTVKEGEELGNLLVDVSSQHAHQSLLKPDVLQSLLDEDARLASAVSSYSGQYRIVKELEKEKRETEANIQRSAEEADYMRFSLRELENADLKVGEEEELKAELEVMNSSEFLKECLSSAVSELKTASSSLSEALDSIRKASRKDTRLSEYLDRTESIGIEADDILLSVRSHLSGIDFPESEMEAKNERLMQLQRIRRRFGGSIEEAIRRRDEYKRKLEEAEQGDAILEKLSERLEKELEEAKASLAKEKDDYLRLMAEFDNYRRRTAQEKLDLVSVASEETIKGLLPVLDDCERAMEVLAKSSDSDAAKEGTELIFNKLTGYLKSKGLAVIEAKDKAFDTDLHEAVAQFPVNEEEKKGKVFDVVQTGYTLNGKVIRFAKVVVGI